MSTSARATAWLVRRELLRFVRQPTRVVAAVGTPLILWVFLASGLGGLSVPAGPSAAGDMDYGAYAFPGVASMIVLFSAIFAAISLIDDRQNGFLRAVLVSPASASAAVLSKLAACAVLSLAQATLVLLAAPLAGLSIGPDNLLLALAALTSISLGVSGVCLACAWFIDSSQGFHGVMNLLLMPMWLLSGAVFPLAASAAWLAWVMRLNPLTWPTLALRDALASPDALGSAHVLPWLGAAAFAVAGIVLPLLAARAAARRRIAA